MTDTTETFPDNAPELPPATPKVRLTEGRWLLAAIATFAFVVTVFYGVHWYVSGLAFGVSVLLTAFVPRRNKTLRLQAVKQRKLRRMWPGTGMKLTVDALPSPCFVADGRGITRYVNKAASEYYGAVKPGDPLSFSLRIPSLLKAFDQVAREGRSTRITWQEKVPTEAWFEAHLAPIYMPGSAEETGAHVPDFVLVVIHDQTEQRRLERMRTDFVANASHELRTPLASLTGFIETLQGPAKDDPQARDRFLQIMLDQAGRMRRLIDDILSLSRIELKVHVRPSEMVDLSEILQHCADALGPLARELEMEIVVTGPDDKAMVRGDRDELIQVVENLVENALKYGSSGKRVDLILEKSGARAGGNWTIRVRDYGEGIPAEHLPRLTERFYRVDVASSRAMKGTGLGLAIVKHILTRHRARLEVDSTLGEGATFSILFSDPGTTPAEG